MTVFSIFFLIGCVYLAAFYADRHYNLQVCAWLNGQCDNPFKQSEKTNAKTQKDKEITELKERIEVLEKCVTEPAYELNQKLNRL